MQSGSDRNHKAMNRPYAIDRFLSIVAKLRAREPSMRLSTDVIVGYPGETEKDFELTKQAFSEAAFEHAFVFKYSERSGTPAAEFEDKVPQEIKELRNQELLSLSERISSASNEKLIGKSMEVLVEGFARKGDGKIMGRTRCFRKIVFEGSRRMIGSLVTVQERGESAYFNCRATIKDGTFRILYSYLFDTFCGGIPFCIRSYFDLCSYTRFSSILETFRYFACFGFVLVHCQTRRTIERGRFR